MTNQLSWRKSSHSGANANGCVELANTFAAVRDSKNPDGPILPIPATQLRRFVTAVASDDIS